MSLYEILWDIPIDNRSAKVEKMTKSIFTALLEEKLIILYWCQELYGKIEPITDIDQAVTLAAEDKYWTPPEPGDRWLRFKSTYSGQELYNELSDESSAEILKKIEANLAKSIE